MVLELRALRVQLELQAQQRELRVQLELQVPMELRAQPVRQALRARLGPLEVRER